MKRLWRRIGKSFDLDISLNAQDIQKVDKSTDKQVLAEYVVKLTKSNVDVQKLGYEITSSHHKKAVNTESLTLTQLMTEIHRTQGTEKKLVAMYKTFTKFSHRRSFFTKSNGLFEWLGGDNENADQNASADANDKWKEAKYLSFTRHFFI